MQTRSSLSVVLIGAFIGIAWGASLRAWMMAYYLFRGNSLGVSWNTFTAILLPTAFIGAILGKSYHVLRSNGASRWRWAVISPILLALTPAVVINGFIHNLVATGVGGGVIAVTLIGLSGSYGLSSLGPWWARFTAVIISGLLVFGIIWGLFWAAAGMHFPSAWEAYVTLYFLLMMIVLVIGVSYPFRNRKVTEVLHPE